MVEISNPLSNFLNLIRWVAAFLVVINHIRGIVFVEFSSLKSHNLIIDMFYFFASLGRPAVIIFFVLSGFLVGGKLVNEIKTNDFSWSQYLIKRITRLYVVLIPALLIGGGLDYFGIIYWNNSSIYFNTLDIGNINYDISSRLTNEIFLSNVFMLQTTFNPTYGSNGPLWSLANEFWYYILFPISVIIFFKLKKKNFPIFYIVLLIILLITLNINIIVLFIIWLLGVFIFIFDLHRFQIKLRYLFILLFTSLVIIKSDLIPSSLIGQIIIACNIVLMIQSVKIHGFTMSNFKNNHILAEFSYTLYLFHFPFILLLTAIMISTLQIKVLLQPSLEAFSLFFFLLISSYIYSFIMYVIFEKNTNKIRNYLRKKLL